MLQTNGGEASVFFVLLVNPIFLCLCLCFFVFVVSVVFLVFLVFLSRS